MQIKKSSSALIGLFLLIENDTHLHTNNNFQ